MAKIQEKQFRARLPKTSHDLSQRNIFTAASGMLLPIWQDMALPGDKYYLDTDVFMRSQPLLTAAMADIDFSIDYFFVPLTMIYTPLQSMLWSTQDYISSFVDYSNLSNLPLFDWMGVLKSIASDFGPLGDKAVFREDDDHNQFERFGKSCIRLMSHLRYNYKMFLPYMVDPSAWEGNNWPGSTDRSPKFFPWQLLAYHTIYYKYYRNEDFEADSLPYRNFDYTSSGDDILSLLGSDCLPFFSCHYLNYKKDYFLSASPTPVFNDISLINNGAALGNIRDSFLSQREIRTGGSDGDSSTLSNSTQTIQSVLNGDPQVSPQYGLGTNDLRKMFAVEKLLRITGRSEKSYDAQVLAHFGFEVPRDVLHNLTFLGSHNGKVHIGEVIATANTAADGTNLGEIAGRGYGKSGNNRQIKFTAPCHGAIMAIFHCQPETNYVGGFDRINAIGDIADFYNPEYDKLGKQPIYQFEVESPFQASRGIELLSNRLGWQYRYSQWKRKYNVISPAFAHPLNNTSTFNNWNSWVIEQKFNDTMEQDVPYINNYTSHVSPRITDSIFAQSFEPRWHDEFLFSPWLIFQYDPFLVNSFISCKKVSVMSQTGEPDIDGI